MFPLIKRNGGDFPGGPVVKTPHFHCRAYGFDLSLIGELRSCMLCGKTKKNLKSTEKKKVWGGLLMLSFGKGRGKQALFLGGSYKSLEGNLTISI